MERLPHESGSTIVTEYDDETGAVLARNAENKPFETRVTFCAVETSDERGPVHHTGDRTAFLGRYGSLLAPVALCGSEPLNGKTGAGLDPCIAFQIPVVLEPGETVTCLVLLGHGNDEAEAQELVNRYRDEATVEAALSDVRAFWAEMVSKIQIKTPVPEIDLMVNGWLIYQNLSCRKWGRSAYYQSGGAFGFRDQLQDAAALVYQVPHLTRAQILRHAAHQFVEGDVMHWWHPPEGRGIRTRFTDDLLWLPYVTAFYVRTTGDAAVLDEDVRFLTARPLEPGEDEAFLLPSAAGQTASVYAHCCRALDRSLTRGPHGLPLIGSGDWNDGMNRIGRHGCGESVWLGFFLYHILGDFIPFCAERGEAERIVRYEAYRAHLKRALNDAGWDGAWYRRAYYDDGTPLGSALSDECQIDAIAQAWAVLSEAVPDDRARQALDALEDRLVSETEPFLPVCLKAVRTEVGVKEKTMSIQEIEAAIAKLPPGQLRELSAWFETYLAKLSGVATDEKPFVSAYDVSKHVAGIIEGPGDLSTNPKYLEGLGESASLKRLAERKALVGTARQHWKEGEGLAYQNRIRSEFS